MIRRCWDYPRYEPAENYINIDIFVARNTNSFAKGKYYIFPPIVIPQFNSSERSKRKHRHNPLKTDYKYKRIFNYKLLPCTKVY